MKKEIEVGKTYKTRGGHDVTVLRALEGDHSYDYEVNIDGNGLYWSTRSGRFGEESPYDIIFEEVKPLIKIGTYTDVYKEHLVADFLVVDGVATDILWQDELVDLFKLLGYDVMLFSTEYKGKIV